MWVSGSDKQQGGKILASSPFSEAKGTVSESGDGAQNTRREAAWAHLVPGASGGGVRGRALAFGNFSDSACRAPGKNVRRRGPSRVKKPETPIRGNNLLQARPLRRSVRGSPAASRRRGGTAAAGRWAEPQRLRWPSTVDGRWMVVQRWGRLPCGEPHRARAPRPSAPRQRLSAAPVSVAVGSGERGVGTAGRGRGQQRGAGPYPPGLAAANH